MNVKLLMNVIQKRTPSGDFFEKLENKNAKKCKNFKFLRHFGPPIQTFWKNIIYASPGDFTLAISRAKIFSKRILNKSFHVEKL